MVKDSLEKRRDAGQECLILELSSLIKLVLT